MKPSELFRSLTAPVLKEMCDGLITEVRPSSSKEAILQHLDSESKLTPLCLKKLKRDNLKIICASLDLDDSGRELAVFHNRLLGYMKRNNDTAMPSSMGKRPRNGSSQRKIGAEKTEAADSSTEISGGFRFSGHQTFPLRLSWLPKAIGLIQKGVDPLTDVDAGITELGLGKNMVEALRCWIEAFQIAHRNNNKWELSHLALLVFDSQKGLDPYLEHHTSAWLLHWLISTNREQPFFAWECLFNRWPSIDFTAEAAIEAFTEESNKGQRPASAVTIHQHWEVFLHSYRPVRHGTSEDHLDCVLSHLNLIFTAEKSSGGTDERGPRYEFDMSIKRSIPMQLFAFCLDDWWEHFAPNDKRVRILDIVTGDKSPGRIFKMTEQEISWRIEYLTRTPKAGYTLVDSTHMRTLQRGMKLNRMEMLVNAYKHPYYE